MVMNTSVSCAWFRSSTTTWFRLTSCLCLFFFFNDTATTEIYTLSLHDALPIYQPRAARGGPQGVDPPRQLLVRPLAQRSEEHTSELQSPCNLVCRLLLEKKKKNSLSLAIAT